MAARVKLSLSTRSFQRLQWSHGPLRCFGSSSNHTTLLENNIIRGTQNMNVPKESVYSLLSKSMDSYSSNIALVDGITGDSFTYRELQTCTHSFAASISRHGFSENNIMGILSSNTPQYPMAALGTLACKGVVSPINPLYTVKEIVHQLRDCKATFLTVEGKIIDHALKASEIVGLEKLFVIGDCSVKDSGIIQWQDIIEDDHNNFSPEETGDCLDDLAFLPYSSGTTGLPKGVMLTNSNIVSNIIQFSSFFREVDSMSSLAVLPFFHIYGLVAVLLCRLYYGHKIVTLPNFQPETFLESIRKNKPETLNLVPPLFQFLLKHPLVGDFDLSLVKEMTTGAAPCAENLHVAMIKRFEKTVIRQGYGLTETSPVAMIQPAANVKPGSTGIVVPGTEVKIVDIETSTALGPNKIGEVCVRGPQVMKGYLGRPEETAKCITDDGWFHSGDLGYYDEDHHFYIVDRLKELIKYKGFQVPPAELEDLLLSHPGISDVAVIGIPDEEAGEVPKAFVVKKAQVSEDELIEFVNNRVAPHKKLRGGLEFIETIPRAQSGKVLRRVLRDGRKRSSS